MKIICNKDELVKGLNIVSKAVPVRTPLSTLDCILIDAMKDSIKLYATDNEIGIETKVEGTIAERGIVALNAKMITEFIKKLNNKNIVVETADNLVTKISYEDGKKPLLDNVIGKPGDEFNLIPVIEGNPGIEITQYTLKDMISKTLFSVSDKDDNRIMTGEFLEVKNNKIRLIAMDGHRISIRSTELANPTEDIKIIVPSKAMSEINKIISYSMEEKVKIYISQKYAIFVFEDTVVYTTLLQGEYFNVDQMLSNDYSTSVRINKQELYETVDRANIFVIESEKRPTIVNINNNILQITLKTQKATFEEDIDIEKSGDDLRIGFNPKFLIEALKAIEDEEINMFFDGQISPLFIKNEEESYIYLILPINIMNEA